MGNILYPAWHNDEVQYYREKSVALCCLFRISKRDSGSLIRVLAQATNEGDKVDVRKFAYLFCEEYQQSMLFLWIKFNVGVLDPTLAAGGFGDDDDLKKAGDSDDDDDNDDEKQEEEKLAIGEAEEEEEDEEERQEKEAKELRKK